VLTFLHIEFDKRSDEKSTFLEVLQRNPAAEKDEWKKMEDGF